MKDFHKASLAICKFTVMQDALKAKLTVIDPSPTNKLERKKFVCWVGSRQIFENESEKTVQDFVDKYNTAVINVLSEAETEAISKVKEHLEIS